MLSVIIPALNSASTISATLSSIFANRFNGEPFEVIVVDNGSSDDTVQIAGAYPVKVYHCSKKGIGPPRNLGAKMARGEVVCFTDSDCLVGRNWLEEIHSFFRQNPHADGVGGPVYPASCFQSKIQKLTGELFVEDQGYPQTTRKTEYRSHRGMIFGSNSAYKKDALLLAGLYSEPGGSNLELVLRLTRAGRNIFFNPSIKTYHVFPRSLKGVIQQQFRWGSQSTQMKLSNRLAGESVKDTMLIPYSLAKRFFGLFSVNRVERRILHFTQLASYSLGQIYGYGHWRDN